MSWVLVLAPAYFVYDQGPELVQAWFGGDGTESENGPGTAIAGSDDDHVLTPAEIEALGRIAPAAGGNTDNDSSIQPVNNTN